jgi:hypothetical protein
VLLGLFNPSSHPDFLLKFVVFKGNWVPTSTPAAHANSCSRRWGQIGSNNPSSTAPFLIEIAVS